MGALSRTHSRCTACDTRVFRVCAVPTRKASSGDMFRACALCRPPGGAAVVSVRPPAVGILASSLWLVKISAIAPVCDMFGQSYGAEDSWPAGGHRAAPLDTTSGSDAPGFDIISFMFCCLMNCDAREVLFSVLFCCDEMLVLSRCNRCAGRDAPGSRYVLLFSSVRHPSIRACCHCVVEFVARWNTSDQQMPPHCWCVLHPPSPVP